jgi:uncharacterized protein YbcI
MSAETSHQLGGELLKDISNTMVGLQKEFGGKGPEKCATHWAGPDALLVLMGGGYTRAEETVFQSGRGNAVRDSRHAFQDAMRERVVETIQRLTGRTVAAFMSTSHQSPDLVAEVFVFESEQENPEHPLAAEDQSVSER